MYIANNRSMSAPCGILNYMPLMIRRYMFNVNLSEAYEIRMRAGKPLMIFFSDGCYYLSSHGMLTQQSESALRITHAHIEEAIEIATKSSVYSVEEEIREGYITLNNGNRMGICGSAVMRDGKITFIKEISSINYRLATEIPDAAKDVVDKVIKNGTVKNTLIISPPGAGKTTMLRDIIRRVSDLGVNVSVVDERREIAAMHCGKSAFELGACTDVLSGVPKSEGMLMALRAMSPDVIAADEIGKQSDCDAIEKLINCGVKIITTIHGYDEVQICKRKEIKNIMQFFETVIVLSKRNGAGTVEKAVELSC
ncbi:MAG: ATPase, T2SS/T4P/T4SS family [Clostridia bacterium]|nr:ATPase, T2SS/T4P/T4SS family [Clostridia bacterium]